MKNEDSYLLSDELQAYAVADGIGGLPYGEKASSCAIKVVSRILLAEQDGQEGDYSMLSLLNCAHESVRIIGDLVAPETGIGTTFSMIRLREGSCELGHVGDSKIYLLNERIQALVPEHTRTVRGFSIKVGSADVSDAVAPPPRTILDQYMGRKDALQPTISTFIPKDQERILICSDGISSSISEDEIFSIHSVQSDCKSFLKALSATAKTRGGLDNLTGISIRVRRDEAPPPHIQI